MFRRHRSAAGWIAIFTIAAVLPALCDTDAAALFASIWVLLPDPVPVLALLPISAPAAHADPLLSLIASRAPPAFLPA